MPVTINQTGAPTPSATPFPPTPAPSNRNSVQHIINPRPIQVTIATPRRKVLATALRQPLQLSHHLIEFSMTPKMHSLVASATMSQNDVSILFMHFIHTSTIAYLLAYKSQAFTLRKRVLGDRNSVRFCVLIQKFLHFHMIFVQTHLLL